MTPTVRWIASLACALALAGNALAAEPVDEAPVRLDGETLYTIKGTLAGFSALERAARAEAVILSIAEDPFYSEELIEVGPARDGVEVRYRGKLVGAITGEGAHLEGMTPDQRADQVIGAVVQGVRKDRERRSPEEWAVAWISLGAASAVLAAVLFGLRSIGRRLRERIERGRQQGLSAPGRRRFGFDANALARMETRALRAALAALSLVAVLLYMQVAFTAVPITRGYAIALLNYVIDPLRALWSDLLASAADIFTVIVMLVLARYALRLLRWLLTEAEHGRISLPRVTPENAPALYTITRLIVIAVTGVMIYPYIPGSDTAAFKGASVFIGALFTFSASGAASSFIGGLVLTFSSRLRVGDRVRFGDVTGDVLERGLVITRLRTIKNEIVTVSNSLVLGAEVINYSAKAREDGLILHTKVSIGYDTSWRTVHDLLLKSATRTTGILQRPEPFILQLSLDDFYVSYELNAYTRDANHQEVIYGELHQNIQDAFREAGVEILSPHYRSLRDGNRSTVEPQSESA